MLGVLDLVAAGLDPESDLGVLVDRSSIRIRARLAALAEALSPMTGPADNRGSA
jgi:hypothetical protein